MNTEEERYQELVHVVVECQTLTDVAKRRLSELVGKLTRALEDRRKKPKFGDDTGRILADRAESILATSDGLLVKLVVLLGRFHEGEDILDELKVHENTLRSTVGDIESVLRIVNAGGVS